MNQDTSASQAATATTSKPSQRGEVEYVHWTDIRTPTSQIPSENNGTSVLNSVPILCEPHIRNTPKKPTKMARRKYVEAMKQYLNSTELDTKDYGPPRCQRLVTRRINDDATSGLGDKSTVKVSFPVRNLPTECGREIPLLTSEGCRYGGLCTWNFCDEHVCETCQTEGSVVDFDFYDLEEHEAEETDT